MSRRDPSDGADGFAYRGKRAFDLAVVALVAVPAALIGAVCAVAVQLTSPGPVLFRQERVGLEGRRFTLLKFRTMPSRADEAVILPTAENLTSAGRVLRRLSLDELPQLINVARGDMSVVGPRPTLAYQVERYDERQWRRLLVRPGLTGLAQVSGRNTLAWADRIELDLEYVGSQSGWLDLSILLRTVVVLLRGKGADAYLIDDPIATVEGGPA